MSLTDWLNRIARATGIEVSNLPDPDALEDMVAEYWLDGKTLSSDHEPPNTAPPTLAEPSVHFGGLVWSRSLVSVHQLKEWGADIPHPKAQHNESAPAIAIPLKLARELAHAQGGRLPKIAEWEAAVNGAAPGNHGLKWGGPTASGIFPAAQSGLLDGWGNAWEWTDEGLAVGGSFASPSHPAPVKHARLTGFRIVR